MNCVYCHQPVTDAEWVAIDRVYTLLPFDLRHEVCLLTGIEAYSALGILRNSVCSPCVRDRAGQFLDQQQGTANEFNRMLKLVRARLWVTGQRNAMRTTLQPTL